MNWRWIVPAVVAFAFIEILAGVAAYGTKTWNLDRTEVLTGWPAVRLVCLVFTPLIMIGMAVFVGLFIALLDWASRGRR